MLANQSPNFANESAVISIVHWKWCSMAHAAYSLLIVRPNVTWYALNQEQAALLGCRSRELHAMQFLDPRIQTIEQNKP